eukprot:Sspe_Gene.107291::Locus_85396_Transcript_1_1_Confidence_1.000_Length_1283::g.107291::m.107291/K11426/SMYD; SET and MYND domain-containing protein
MSEGLPFAVHHTPSRGRHAVAVRPLNSGDTVLEEEPFATAAPPTHCSGCLTPLVPEEVAPRFCSHCPSPPACRAVGDLPVPLLLALVVASKVTVDRPPLYDLLLEHREKLPMADIVADSEKLGEQTGVDAGLIAEALCKTRVNSFAVGGVERKVGDGLYLTASVFNHSCSPNALATFTGPSLRVVAVGNIAVGDEVCIAYTDLGQGTPARRADLLAGHHFVCCCDRCATEDTSRYTLLCCPQCGATVQHDAAAAAPRDVTDFNVVCRCGHGLSEAFCDAARGFEKAKAVRDVEGMEEALAALVRLAPPPALCPALAARDLAFLFLQQGNPELALPHFARALEGLHTLSIRRYPTEAFTCLYYTQALVRTGRGKEARIAAELALPLLRLLLPPSHAAVAFLRSVVQSPSLPQ